MNNRSLAGFSLIEIMIALTISMIAIAGAVQAYSFTRLSFQATTNITQLEARAAFALKLLGDDIQRAGYYGLHNDGTRLRSASPLNIHCNGLDVSIWAARPEIPVGGSDGAYDLPCPASGSPIAGSDTLTLRFASSATALPDATRVQLHTNTLTGALQRSATVPALSTPATTRNFHVNAWYLDTHSSEAGEPALRRFTLTRNGLMQNQEIMPGIESFHARFGYDANADGLADEYVDPDAIRNGEIVAVQVGLLIRSPYIEPGYREPGAIASIDRDEPAQHFNDNKRRIYIERTFALRNARKL